MSGMASDISVGLDATVELSRLVLSPSLRAATGESATDSISGQVENSSNSSAQPLTHTAAAIQQTTPLARLLYIDDSRLNTLPNRHAVKRFAP